jgi:hypothetical protein
MLGFVSFIPLFAGIAVEPSHPFSSVVNVASVASSATQSPLSVADLP